MENAAARGFNHSKDNLAAFGKTAKRSTPEGQAAALARIQAEVRRLGLEQQISDLSLNGYAIVPPEKVAPPEFILAARDAILKTARKRSGVEPDLETGKSHDAFDAPFGQMLVYMLFEDPIFEQMLMNETSVALVNALLGERCLLSSSRAFLKGRGRESLGLHCDYVAPAPFPSYSSMCNVTWALTDYSKENGGLAIVPGSHRLGRRPTAADPLEQAIAIEAPAGSMIIFDGYTWHGAFSRSNSGLRVAYANIFCRPYISTLERYRDATPPEALARNGDRFADFTGQYIGWGIDASGADMQKLGESAHAAMGLY